MITLNILTSALACVTIVEAAAIRKRALSFDYNDSKVRGVNLGGWFVLEPWITPSIFDEWADGGGVVDEYTYTQTLGPTEATSRLTQHWNTWINQADFNQIAAFGLNHVRIPIGYWAVAPLEGDPYVQGQLPILDQAIIWAREAGLKILLDLHGAPGSQNGFDNSGRYGPIDWTQGSTVSQTLTAIQALANRYAGDTDVVTAIEVLNEPMGPNLDMNVVKQFYYDGYGNIRNANADTAVVIHDAFLDIDSYWNGFMNTGVNNVILDTHNYQIFSDGQVSMSPSQHISAACAVGPQVKETDKWLIVGEWTGAQTDCAMWLNGLGKGARYDGTFAGGAAYGSCEAKSTGTVADMLAVDKTNIRQYIEAQMDAFEQHTGWIFWAWKTESAPEWHFQDLVLNGLVPQPLTDRQYPNQCGF
jgi:glucan 1,3-beta-glucosidase